MDEEPTGEEHDRPRAGAPIFGSRRPWAVRLGLRRELSGPDDRHAHMFEHFFDLTYVVILAELTEYLSEHGIGAAFKVFLVLFIPAWWVWISNAYYMLRFGRDDAIERLLVILELIAVAGIALSIHKDGLGAGAAPFAAGVAATRTVLALLYSKCWITEKDKRAIAWPFIVSNVGAATFWGLSIGAAESSRFALWAAGMGVTLFPMAFGAVRSNRLSLISALPERFRLFSVIVLSEAVKTTIDGLTESGETATTGSIAGALALVMAAAIWWIYYENIDFRHLRKTSWARRLWVNIHLPILAAFSVASSGVERLMATPFGAHVGSGTRWLVCGAVAAALGGMGAIHVLTDLGDKSHLLAAARFGGALLAVGCGILFASFNSLTVIGTLALVCIAQVIFDYSIDSAVRPASTT